MHALVALPHPAPPRSCHPIHPSTSSEARAGNLNLTRAGNLNLTRAGNLNLKRPFLPCFLVRKGGTLFPLGCCYTDTPMPPLYISQAWLVVGLQPSPAAMPLQPATALPSHAAAASYSHTQSCRYGLLQTYPATPLQPSPT